MNKQPLNEYPRPQLKRDSYICLNGIWEYAIRKEREFPNDFDGKILVPYSPEVEKSGVNKLVMPDDYLFYKTKLSFPQGFIKDKVILHFGAVDQIAEVFVNNKLVIKHIGGFLPFSVDIKPFIKGENDILTLRVQDTTNSSYHSSGKQALKPEGIWYTPQSGIYMPVWMESVNKGYIKELKLTPDIDEGLIKITVFSESESAIVCFQGSEYTIKTNIENEIRVHAVHLWSPDDPYLYDMKIKTKSDEVNSYFAMRKASIEKDEKGKKVIFLNNKPCFNKGVLDQGYYKDGLLTPNSDEDYINDIKLIKS